MSGNDKKIRELKEAMRAERNIRIRNRMMSVLRVLEGHSTGIAADFADVDRRTVQLWAARFNENDIGDLRDAPRKGRISRARYRRIRRLADHLAGRNLLTPRKLRNWIRERLHIRYSLCSVRRILRHLGSHPRGRPSIRLGCRRRYGKVVAGRRRRHDIGGKKVRIDDHATGRVHVSQNRD